MKRILVGIAALSVLLAVLNLAGANAQNEAAPPPSKGQPALLNPLKIALLKWYPANLTTSFKVGNEPSEVAFDGANIWVSNNGDNTVSKLRASDGAVLGTFSVGVQPIGLAFDGANIWVANSYVNTVTKLRASDGKNLGTFGVGTAPWFLAFDGQDIWVTNSRSGSITKLRVDDGKILGTFTDGGGPRCIAFDGTYMWVTNFDDTVTRFKLDGTSAGTFSVAKTPFSLAFDGSDIFVASSGGTVTKLRASDGKLLGTFNLGGTDGEGIAFDGQNLWLTASPYIAEIRRSDGAILLVRRLEGGLGGMAFDGANIWVAGYTDDSIFKL